MKIEIIGIEEVDGMLARAEDVEPNTDKVLRDFAYGTHGKIQRLVPTREHRGGLLRGRQGVFVAGNATVVFFNPMHYARYVELGTGRRGGASYEAFLPDEVGPAYATYWAGMAAQPYMRPPIAEGMRNLDARLDEIAKRVQG